MATELTDRELDVWLAEHLFELPVEVLPTRYSPESGEAAPITFQHEQGRLADAPREPFVHIDRHPYDGGIDGMYVDGELLESYSSTGDGMLLVLEAMRERGYGWSVYYKDGGACVAVFSGISRGYGGGGSGASFPRAVAEAAKAALETP